MHLRPHSAVAALATIVLVVLAVLGCASDSANPDNSAQTATLAVPDHLGPPPGSYTIDGDARPVVIPFEYYGMNLMVDAEMSGTPIKMLIDNGVMWDELWFFTNTLTDSLGIEYEQALEVTGAGEGEGMDSFTASDVAIRFGDVQFTHQPAIITPAGQRISEMFPGVDGQLCGCFFKHFVTEFDFDEQRVILHEPAGYVYDGDGVALPMTRDEVGSYSIPVTVGVEGGKLINMDIFIDLGGVNVAHLVIDEEAGILRPDAERVLLGHGASGPIHGYRGKLESLTVGGYTLIEPPTVFTEAPEGGDSSNVIIGLPAFQRFTVVFDYFREILYLEPNSHFAEPYGE